MVERKVDTWRDERDALPVEFERNETRKETRNERNAQERPGGTEAAGYDHHGPQLLLSF